MKKLLALILAAAMVFALTGCIEVTISPAGGEEEAAPEEEAADEDVPLLGGWTKAESPVVPDDVKEAFEAATGELVGAEYEPVAFLESQVVAGMNYLLLAKETIVVPDAVPTYSIVKIYKDAAGEASLAEVLNSEAEALAAAPGEEGLAGGWFAPDSVELTDEAKAALEKAAGDLLGAEYEPVALLATQVVAGLNYEILCRITPVVPDAESKYAIVHVYEDLEGNAEITDIFEFGETEE